MRDAAIAQQVERILGKDEVTGSNPVISSSKPTCVIQVGFLLRCDGLRGVLCDAEGLFFVCF